MFLIICVTGADINRGNEEFISPLAAAAAKNDIVMVQVLLDHKCNIHKLKDGRPSYLVRTPLHYAIKQCNVTMVRMLLAAGHDVNAPTLGDLDPLQDALICRNANIVQLIINHPNCNFQPKKSPWCHLFMNDQQLHIGKVFLTSNKAHLFHNKGGRSLLSDILSYTSSYDLKMASAKLIVRYGGDTVHAQNSVYADWLNDSVITGTVHERMPVIMFLLRVGLRPSQDELRKLQKLCSTQEERGEYTAVEKICSQPMSLEKYSQLVIRYSLGVYCTQKAKYLPLPTALCKFVATNGIRFTEIEGRYGLIFKADCNDCKS